MKQKGIRVAIIAVPPETAQAAADSLVRAGVRSIVDFTAVPLRVPDERLRAAHGHHLGARDRRLLRPPGRGHSRRLGDTERENGDESGSEAEMEPIIHTIDSLLAGADMKLDDLARRIGAKVLTPGPADAQDHPDLRRRPGERPAERGLQHHPAGDQPGQPADGAGGGTHGSAGHLLRRRSGARPGDGRARLAQPHHAHGLPRGRVRDLRAHLPTAGRFPERRVAT